MYACLLLCLRLCWYLFVSMRLCVFDKMSFDIYLHLFTRLAVSVLTSMSVSEAVFRCVC